VRSEESGAYVLELSNDLWCELGAAGDSERRSRSDLGDYSLESC
jgi:hypothetical protein